MLRLRFPGPHLPDQPEKNNANIVFFPIQFLFQSILEKLQLIFTIFILFSTFAASKEIIVLLKNDQQKINPDKSSPNPLFLYKKGKRNFNRNRARSTEKY